MASRFATLTTEDLPELLALCSAALPLDPFTAALLERRIYRDDRYDPQLVFGLHHGGRLVGAVAGVVRQDPDDTRCGWMKLLAVDPAHLLHGIGRQLVMTLETLFQRRGATRMDTVGHPGYFWPGVDVRYTPACCLLEKLGFTEHRYLVNMTVDLTSYTFDEDAWSKRLAAGGYTLVRAEGTTMPDIADLIARHWPLWSHEPLTALSNDPVSMFCIRQADRVVAYAAYDIEMFPGTFGSIGTDPQHRGSGLGAALLHACLADMRRKGYRRAEIPWVGPVAFYAKHGAVISRVFRDYRKTLNPET